MGLSWGIHGYFTLPYAYVTNPNLADDFWVLTTVKDSATMKKMSFGHSSSFFSAVITDIESVAKTVVTHIGIVVSDVVTEAEKIGSEIAKSSFATDIKTQVVSVIETAVKDIIEGDAGQIYR